MVEALNKISVFFKKDFKKKFIVFVSIPLLLSTLLSIDCFLLPSYKETDHISQVYYITISNSGVGRASRSSQTVGHKYLTQKGYSFSTEKGRVIETEITLHISPIFKLVKKVTAKNRKIRVNSGMQGINLVFLIGCMLTVITSLIYIFIMKEISKNARLNLIFVNLFIFILWTIVIIQFGI